MKLTNKQKQIIAEFESNFEYEDLTDIQSLIYALEDGEVLAKIYDLEERDEDQDEPSDYENEVQEKTEFLHTYYQNKLRQQKQIIVDYNKALISKCDEYREQIRAAKKGIQEESLINNIRDELYKTFPSQDHHGIYEDITEYVKSHEFWA
jgi:hypothetical protein